MSHPGSFIGIQIHPGSRAFGHLVHDLGACLLLIRGESNMEHR